MAFNAGTSVLHLGPWREIITPEDLCDLDVLAARLYYDYGIYLSETCAVRQLWMNPRHPGSRMLKYNCPDQLLCMTKSRQQLRREKNRGSVTVSELVRY